MQPNSTIFTQQISTTTSSAISEHSITVHAGKFTAGGIEAVVAVVMIC
jgi:hypothetical protein